ncbi:MAG TPA: acetyl-CoA carboxylase biotin carboxyl carrier protein [Aurantimonas coralicida]|nr:acetyl-CoA carboxylase biotin carboxyl carrier protein [Phycisphaerae bacterium]HEU00849.1 acetyl-CoA carboxylase biotin carboxyl carrier protein [Aurantimonas coralicida]
MIEDVRELVDLMTAHDITEVNFEDGDKRIVLRRGPPAGAPAEAPAESAMSAANSEPAPSRQAEPAPADADSKPADELFEILSPMVGTFYASASPDGEPYAAHGARITEDTVVCIVEAMKVMNEIRAECSGTIAEICVKNTQPVEYGQVLFRVMPA